MGHYYTEQGYAVVIDDSPSNHQFGGDAYHDGATCPVCKIPLLLLADFDCDSIRQTEKAKLFHELDRLPLYYCWKCCAEKLSYQIDSGSLKVFKNEGKRQGNDFPYPAFPKTFPKRSAKLTPIPYETAKLLAVAQEIDEYWLKESDKEAIKNGLEKLRHPWFSNKCLNRHQMGGLLNLLQGHEYIVCPNPDCKNHQLAREFGATRMMELAAIHNDPHSGMPMCERIEDLSDPTDFNEFVQVVYWVCEECLTIAASNRCD
ncbi:MAG TPA: hypothetical protein VN873_14925 [Candidatus Angelobacter sp.]|nr:hypothetical protein [Candidatus Angelobacter sp.]